MSAAADFQDRELPSGRSHLAAGEWRDKSRESRFRNRLATVEIYEWTGGERLMCVMRFTHNGSDYFRSWDHQFGDKALARLAREFVEEKTGERCNG